MPIYPQHEQTWPRKLLAHRLEEYVLPDGPPTTDRRSAQRVTGQQALDAVTAVQARLGLTSVDPRYYVGTCFHEAGCTNEVDTEVATASCPPGYVSVGAYQIGDEEAQHYGYGLWDMLDLDEATECMVKLAESHRTAIRLAAKLPADAPDPDYTDSSGRVWVSGTMRAYLAIAHNHGTGFATTSVVRHGLDWGAYKARNPTDNIVCHGYGEDCVTGGPFWPAVAAPARLLMLEDPMMTGDDVRALQRLLRVPEDGKFGPATDRAVRAFQSSVGLVADGEVGPKTLSALKARG